MQIDRRAACGSPDPDEPLNKSQVYVTTAGWKNSFPYQKLIALLVRMVIEPEKAFVIGGTWRIPVAVGLQSRSFINDLRRDATMNDVSFSREFKRLELFKYCELLESPQSYINYNVQMKYTAA